jgi:hypothetical protein
MSRAQSKQLLRIMAKPYSVKTLKGESLYFADKREALVVSWALGAVYSVFLTDARAWVPIGIIFDDPR